MQKAVLAIRALFGLREPHGLTESMGDELATRDAGTTQDNAHRNAEL